MSKSFKQYESIHELTPSSMTDDMVESRNEFDETVKGISQIRLHNLRKSFLEEDLLTLQLQVGWKKFSEEEKIQRSICNAEFVIMKWHVKLMEQTDAPKTFEEWKTKLIEKFGELKMNEAQYARINQRGNETLLDFILKMEDLGESLGIKEEKRFNFIIEGIRSEFVAIKCHIIMEEKFTPKLMRKIKIMEEDLKKSIPKTTEYKKINQKTKSIICFICDGNHFTTSCPENPKISKKSSLSKKNSKDINEVDQEERDFALNKDSFIYVNFQKWFVVLDTGAEDNFISEDLAEKFKVPITNLKVTIKRYTVDGREIVISKKLTLEFYHEKSKTMAEFYILPGFRKNKILLGKKWMRKQNELKKFECCITTKPGMKVVEPSWTLPQKLKEGTDKAIEEYERKGYIRDSHSTWSNNIRPVEKSDGTVRIATNLVALNKLVELDKYSLPNMEELLFSLKGKKWFSKIDLKDGFFQIPLREEDKHKTAFRHGHKLKEWNVMPMGFKNAPAVFQRFMDNILRAELGNSCLCYVDDILIFGDSEQEHDDNLYKIKQILGAYNMEINDKKSIYKKKEIEFLGHLIKEDIIEKQIDDQEAIKNYPVPKNKTEIQSFLGLINYYRKFIRNITELCLPLYVLLRKDTEFNWDKEKQNSFELLKNELLKPSILHQPDYTKTFILETDASNNGLGAILTQKLNGNEYPIAYASRMLIGAEKNYSISEKECLGAIYGMEKFKYHLYGREFILRTDHKALEKLNSGPLKSARIERWCERLQHFSFTVEYRKGESIPHVDALSRNIQEINEITMDSNERIELFQRTHNEMIHRGAKAVAYRLKNQGICCNENEIKEAIKDCLICKAYNPKRTKNFKFINSFERGEKVGFDIMGPLNGEYIITAIDYFTREGFAKRILNRESKHVLNFLKEINLKFKVKTFISDGARENCDKIIKEWLSKEGIKHHITSAHHPESNGRIERFNKSILDGLRKGNLKGLLQVRLNKILEQYHDTYHDGIGMTPREAADVKNWDGIKRKTLEDFIEKYKKKYRNGKWDKLKLNQEVLIRTEVGRKKIEPLFKEKGSVIEILEDDAYVIKPENGRSIKRHISQLKGIRTNEFIRNEEDVEM